MRELIFSKKLKGKNRNIKLKKLQNLDYYP